jgi:hypothetical protein
MLITLYNQQGTGRTLGLVTIGVIREFVAGPANALLRPTCDALNNSSRSPLTSRQRLLDK